MTLRTNTAEGGTAGATVTTANSGSGSGSAFDTVSVSATAPSVFQFSTAQAMHGTKSYRQVCEAGTSVFYRHGGASAASMACRAYIRFVSVPATAGEFLHIRDTAGAIVASIATNTTQKLTVRGKSATLQDNWFTPSLNVWYRLELRATKGTGTTDGTVAAAVYLGDDTAAQVTYSATNVDAGTVNLGTACYGKASSSGASEFFLDDMAVDDGRTSFIGPAVNQPPTVGMGSPVTLQAGSVATCTATDADVDGTISSRQWAFSSFGGVPEGVTAPALTGATTQTVSFTPTVPGIYGLTYTVTDNNGATAQGFQFVYAYPPSGTDIGVATNGTGGYGGWSQFGSASSIIAGLNDTNDTTGIISAANPTNSGVFLQQLNPIGPGDIRIYITGYWTDAPITRTIQLLKEDGTTIVDQWTQAPTSSISEQLLIVSAAGLALIPTVADRRALRLRITSAVAT